MTGERTDFLNILSFDVEEWFHLRRTEEIFPVDSWPRLEARLPAALDRVLEILDRTENRATFFWLGWCAERYPEWVRRCVEAGHEIACHGWSHTALDRLAPEQFREELRQSRARLEDLACAPVRGFRAPSLSLGPPTAWMLEALAHEGFTYDSSLLVTSIRVNRPAAVRPEEPLSPHLLNGLADRLRDWRPWRWETVAGPIVELPLSVLPFGPINLPFGGGFFFRCSPWWALVATIGRMNARGEPAVVYAHPWEFDADSPAPRRPRLERFSHRFLARTGRRKYLRLLERFRFSTASEFLETRVF